VKCHIPPQGALDADFSEQSYEDKTYSQKDKRFLSYLEKNFFQDEDGHGWMPLPFMHHLNCQMAVSRLQCLEKRMKGNQ